MPEFCAQKNGFLSPRKIIGKYAQHNLIIFGDKNYSEFLSPKILKTHRGLALKFLKELISADMVDINSWMSRGVRGEVFW